MLNWVREENVLEKIKIDFSQIQDLKKNDFPHGYYGLAKNGSPIYIEQYGKMDIKKILAEVNEEK